MEELLDLKQRLEGQRPASWQELPDIALYMDQIISYMPRQLIHFDEGEALTSAMVNNYIKEGWSPGRRQTLWPHSFGISYRRLRAEKDSLRAGYRDSAGRRTGPQQNAGGAVYLLLRRAGPGIGRYRRYHR